MAHQVCRHQQSPSIFVGESFKNEDLTNCQTNTRGGGMKIPALHVVNWGYQMRKQSETFLGWWTGHQKNDVWWIWGAWSSRSTSIAICKLWMGYTVLLFNYSGRSHCLPPVCTVQLLKTDVRLLHISFSQFFQWQSTHIDTGKPFTDSTVNLVLAGSQSKLGNSSGSNCEKLTSGETFFWASVGRIHLRILPVQSHSLIWL